MTFNLRKLYPDSSLILMLYQITMLLSNLAALVGGFVMLRLTGMPLWMKALYFVADVGVVIGRQLHALKEWSSDHGSHSSGGQPKSLTAAAAATGDTMPALSVPGFCGSGLGRNSIGSTRPLPQRWLHRSSSLGAYRRVARLRAGLWIAGLGLCGIVDRTSVKVSPSPFTPRVRSNEQGHVPCRAQFSHGLRYSRSQLHSAGLVGSSIRNARFAGIGAKLLG